MFEVIQKLLILQDRDRRIAQLSEELARVNPERENATLRQTSAQQKLDTAKHRMKQIESDRKKLELDVEAKKELISRYGKQQFETRKNEEYRALAHEIETCKQAISKIEDQEIVLMEQAELAQKEAEDAQRAQAAATKISESQLADLARLEANVRKDLHDLQANRAELAAGVEEVARNRYERLAKSKGYNVVVGVERASCGGCHMRVPAQLLVQCRGQQELVTCSNCGRILYFDQGMDLTAND